MSAIADTIRGARLAKGWSVQQAAVALRAIMAQPPQLDSLVRKWKRWEAGDNAPGDAVLAWLCELLDIDPILLGQPAGPDRLHGEAISEWFMEFERSDIGPGTINTLHATVDRLCRDYPVTPTTVLREDVWATLKQAMQLRDRRPTLDQQREILVAAGWLNTLLACLLWDNGSRYPSEMAADTARRLSDQALHDEISGWTWEMNAWHSLTAGRYHEAVVYAESGEHVAPGTNAAVHCAVHTARGWARIGDLKQSEAALNRAERSLERLTKPTPPGHHFQFDPSKLLVARACCYTWLGKSDQATEAAHQVLLDATLPDGSLRWPMRCAEMQALLALDAGRQGDLDQAVTLGLHALNAERVSGPALVEYASDLAGLLRKRWPDEHTARPFLERYEELRTRFRVAA